MNQTDYINYILYGFQVPADAFQKFIDTTILGNNNFLSDLVSLIELYYLIFGGILIVFIFAVSWVVYSKSRLHVERIQFILTLLPFDKLNEEITIHILKNLWNQ